MNVNDPLMDYQQREKKPCIQKLLMLKRVNSINNNDNNKRQERLK